MRDNLTGALAVLVGLVVISMGTELVEFALVTIANRGVVTDPEPYFAVRNRPTILAAKIFYNAGFALLGGYVASRIGRATGPVWILAALQTAFLAWGAFAMEMGAFTPMWMWLALIALTGPAIVAGGRKVTGTRSVP